MANDGEFQEQVRQLGKLVAQFDELPDSDAKVAGRELVQLLMEVHARGLERAMEIVFDAGNFAPGIVDKMGRDPIVGNLLLLYSLHPDEFETRVQKAIEGMRPRLRKLSCTVELECVHEGAVRVRLSTSSHSCGSSTNDLRSIVEDGMYEFAPDVTSLEVLGLEEPTPTGFVTLESLMGQRLAGVGAGSSPERDGVD
ncbi:NifU family protein [Tunturibacter empetritectus]|uniref:Fe-S cluster biogenesis protein NfuA n=1 Tax=Tunturiibacter lichenicola TaxID=2051959 RepID=A0A7W8J4G1_9BACT|nr:NifU family protein [Edaphobacter lichenicola]MBB5342388.1 Fe-S cluster biogenesis protein NfuA [Edaphobacter lichenicola]